MGRVRAPGPAERAASARGRPGKRKIAVIRKTWTATTSSVPMVIAIQYAVRMSSAFGECPARGPRIDASAGAARPPAPARGAAGPKQTPPPPGVVRAFGSDHRSPSAACEEAAGFIPRGAKAAAFYS